MHDAASAPLCTLVLHASRAIEEGGAGTDQSETCVLLRCGGSVRAILANEVVKSELGGVEDAVKVDFDRLEVWLFWGLIQAYGAPRNSQPRTESRSMRETVTYHQTRKLHRQ